MHAFLISLGTVALAEMGDRTQLLSLMLVARYGRPWPIIGGILVATLANHFAAALLGDAFGRALSPGVLDLVVGAGLVAMAVWTLRPDRLDDGSAGLPPRGVFVATAMSFFIAEIGDKTQIATVALAAGYASLGAVVVGTTSGMLVANVPVVLLGNAFAARLPLRAIRLGAALLFAVLGAFFLVRGLAAGRI